MGLGIKEKGEFVSQVPIMEDSELFLLAETSFKLSSSSFC